MYSAETKNSTINSAINNIALLIVSLYIYGWQDMVGSKAQRYAYKWQTEYLVQITTKTKMKKMEYKLLSFNRVIRSSTAFLIVQVPINTTSS